MTDSASELFYTDKTVSHFDSTPELLENHLAWVYNLKK